MKKIIIAGVVFVFIQIIIITFLIVLHFSISSENQGLEAGIIASKMKSVKIPDFIKKMSLEQKVGQLIHIGMTGKSVSNRSSVIKNIKHYYVGGVIGFAVNYGTASEVIKLNEALQKASIETTGIPLFISSDQEGGRVFRIGPDGATQFPGAMALGQTGDESLAYDVGFVTGYELRKLGIDMIFAPVLDINNNPKNPVIQTRSFGSSANVVSLMATAYMTGMQQAYGTPVIKHFPGHGDTNIDSHHALPVIQKSKKELKELELIPFQKAIDLGAEAVMSAHILFPSLDKNKPATLSTVILQGLLKKEMGFSGLIISDAMEMKAIADRYGQGEAAILAFEAGIDIILLTSEGRIIKTIHNALLGAFRSGRLKIEDLNLAVTRQINLKKKKLLFERWNSNLLQNKKINDKKLKQFNQKNHERFLRINKKYEIKSSNLNQEVSRKSIRSLRKDYNGVKASTNIVLFYRSKTMAMYARKLGLLPKNIRYLKRFQDLNQILKKTKSENVYAIELSPSRIKMFNRLVKNINSRDANAPSLIALYAHNPFLNIHIPDKGAVLVSFSPTAESKKALLFQLLSGKQIQQADLVLNPALK